MPDTVRRGCFGVLCASGSLELLRLDEYEHGILQQPLFQFGPSVNRTWSSLEDSSMSGTATSWAKLGLIMDMPTEQHQNPHWPL